ncbi:MAG: HIT domain-containing protein [Pseudomonadota bacterium]|nr:HIT domain-containing protein [Pseudomonadota bacterium]
MLDLESDGCRIISNFGNHGRQEVPHIHFNLIGGKDIGPMISKL